MREYIRKKMVYLKRNPQIIPLLILIASCIIFTFNLSMHSTATMRIPKASGLNVFIITLASIMAIVSFISVKNFNKKALFPIIIVLALVFLQTFLNIVYLNTVASELAQDSTLWTQNVEDSKTWVTIHIVFLVLSFLSIVLLPIYRQWINKINTEKKEKIVFTDIIGVKTNNEENQ